MSAAATPRVVTFGEAMIRLSTLDHEPLGRAATLALHVGGAEVNVAVALARLGVSCSWISALPDVPLGRRVISEVAAAGVVTSSVTIVPDGRVGLYFVEFGASPRPTSVWYDRADSAFARQCDIPPDALVGARYAVVSGMTTALSERAATKVEIFASRACEAGVGLVVDVNYRERLASTQEARRATGALLTEAEIVVCSARDATTVFGIDGSDAEVVVELKTRFAPDAKLVCLTCGDRGSIAIDGAGELTQVPVVPSTIVDRFGGGDAFLAGLIDTLLRDGTVEEALQFGSNLAALKCTIHGDLSTFTRDEVLAAAGQEVLRR